MKVRIKKLHKDAVVPKYAKPGDAGLDLTAVAIKENYDALIDEITGIKVMFGLSIEIHEGYVGLIFPRSSIKATGLRLSNSVGVIDSGYRGELQAYFDIKDYSLKYYSPGERCAQLIIIPYPQIEFEEVDELTDTERGEGGYGSTGN